MTFATHYPSLVHYKNNSALKAPVFLSAPAQRVACQLQTFYYGFNSINQNQSHVYWEKTGSYADP